MASHYDRMSGQYATRPSPIAGPSRGDPFYDRDRRVSYPPRPEAEYIEEAHLPTRRDDRAYYPPQQQQYPGPPRESRGEVWIDNSWPRHPSVYPPHTSPPPPPPPVSAQYPRYYQESRPPPSPQWEERSRWENPPDDRSFEHSVSWRDVRHEPSYPRLNSLLNPTPPSPRFDDYRRREPVPVPMEPPPVRDYGVSYPPEYHQRPPYYDRPPIPETHAFIPNDAYRQPPIERPAAPPAPHRETYRPEMGPGPRASRHSSIRDYKRPRQELFNQPHRPLDTDTAHWTSQHSRQGSLQSGHSRQGSLQSARLEGVSDRERTVTGPSQTGSRSVLANSNQSSPATKASRNAWEGSSDEIEFSGDESVRGMNHPAQAMRQTLHQTLQDITRSRDGFGENSRRVEDQGASGNVNRVVTNHSPTRPVPKPPQPVIRHAWDPSTDQFVPIMDNSARIPWKGEKNGDGSTFSVNTSNHSGPVNSVSYQDISHVRRDVPMSRANQVYSPKKGATLAPSSNVAQGGGSSRQGVMSVHDLVSPSPVKPVSSSALPQRVPTPLLLEDDSMQVESSDMMERSTVRRSGTLEASSVVTTRARLTHPEESSFDQSAFSVARPKYVPGLERPRSTSDEPSFVGYSQVATPDIYTPEPDADRTLAEVETQIAGTTISSPKPSVLLQPGEKISQDGTMRILAPRPKADKKDITEMLRRAIMLRREYDAQSREQRVNPILMDNLAKSDGPEQKLPSSSGNLVEDIVERFLTQTEEEHQMNTRSILATKSAEESELLAEKMQKLRDEYLTLHKRWIAHCTNLDSLFKANEMQEALTQAGRTTRRSATTLGDAVRSDLEMEQIIASLGNEDLTDPNHLAVRNVATIPDMISVVKGKIDYLFDDTNNEVDDPANFYDPRSGYYDWTPEEEAIFYAKYADNPKQFGIIAKYLPHKTAHQCVLYYYIHKKKIVDFRNAANSGNGKRRKGVRKGNKQKGNALLADVAQADSKRPAGRGRRGRGGFANGGRGRHTGPPPSTEESVDADPRTKRRKVGNMPKQYDFDDVLSVDTDNTRETSILPPKKRRGRKPKVVIAAESAGESPAPGEMRSTETSETTSRRKPGSTSTYWSESDRATFMRLLARYGKDFKRIAVELPNKTHVQVGNYYKNHNRELGLEKIALAAVNRLRSPEQDCFVTVTRAEAAQSRTPTEEVSVGQLVDRQVADATSAVGVLTLEQNGNPGQSVFGGKPNPRAINNKTVMKIFNSDAFQFSGANKPQGVIITPNGQSAYTLSVDHQPARPQSSASMTSSTMDLQRLPGSGSLQRNAEQDKLRQSQNRPKSQPSGPTVNYPFQPHAPMVISTGHSSPDPYISAARPAESLHRIGQSRNGIPAHLLPSTQPGFLRDESSSRPPGDISRKPGRQE